MPHERRESPPAGAVDRAGRWLLAGTGMVLVAVAVLGALLPGLPTTIFLLGASWCFTRSCPWLDERLRRLRLFRPYVAYMDGHAPLPPKLRLAALVSMWCAVIVSTLTLRAAGALSPVGGALLIGAGIVATFVIWRWRRTPRGPAAPDARAADRPAPARRRPAPQTPEPAPSAAQSGR